MLPLRGVIWKLMGSLKKSYWARCKPLIVLLRQRRRPPGIVIFLLLLSFSFRGDFFVSMSFQRFSRSLNRLENWRRHSTQAARTANPSADTAPFVGAARYHFSFQTACRLRQRLRPTVDAFETLSQRDWSTPSATSQHR